MSRFSLSRLLAPDLLRALAQARCSTLFATQCPRLFSQSHAAKNIWSSPSSSPPQQSQPPPPAGSVMGRLAQTVIGAAVQPTVNEAPLSEQLGLTEDESEEPYHFHIYSHKHNTHITLTKPNRDAIISLSCGNIGFRKSARKHYDSAYQLGTYVLDKMNQKGLIKKIHKLEVVLRGFGQGREAVVKLLMGQEGAKLRPKIVRVSDATRLKFGGTRSKKPRRLG